MYRKKVRLQINDTVLLSGWVFADLLLGLMVVFLVSLPGSPAPELISDLILHTPTATIKTIFTATPTNTVNPTVTPTSTLTPIPTATRNKVVALSQKEVKIEIKSIYDLREIRQKIREVSPGDMSNMRVGLVLTSGYGGSNINLGHTLARSLNDTLRKEFPTLFESAVMRDYHDIAGQPVNGAELIIYMLVEMDK